MNYSGKINLLRLINACIVTVRGATAAKKGVFIPIEDNGLFVSADENLKAKGAYLDFNAWETQTPSKYGDTHAMRLSLSKELRERMTDEELKSVPYIGGMKPFEAKNQAAACEAPVLPVCDNAGDDLPF